MESRIREIHNSLENGQRKQMVELIDEYGLYDFWDDYRSFLRASIFPADDESAFDYFADAVISYHRIKNH